MASASRKARPDPDAEAIEGDPDPTSAGPQDGQAVPEAPVPKERPGSHNGDSRRAYPVVDRLEEPARGEPGDPAAARVARLQAQHAEKDVALVRLFIVVFNVLVYALLLPRDVGVPVLAAAVTVVALGYSVVVVLFEPYRRFPALATSTFTVATDSALIILWLMATGGAVSPFYPLWAVSLVAVTFRFGPRMAGVAAGIYIAGDLAVFALSGVLVEQYPAALVRAAYIGFIGMLGTMVGQQVERAFLSRVRVSDQLQEQRLLHEEQERFRILAEAALEGLLIHDQGRIVEANQEAARILGFGLDELEGVHVAELVAPESWAVVEQHLEHPSDEPYEVFVQRRDGTKRRMRVQARTMVFRGRPCRVTALRDVTEEREAEEARLQSQKQAAEIERLQEIDAFKTQFINTAAHELNTPLTPLKLQLHILRMTLEEHPRALDILERNLDRLAGLVADMLDVARLESGRLRIEPEALDLAAVLHEAAATYAPVAEEKALEITIEAPEALQAFGDPRRVRQVVDNLLSNAVKFTEKRGTIRLRARDHAEHVTVSVEDDGIGMEADQIERLFQPFTQVHEPRADLAGTGLGLFICSKLLEAMSGEIRCESAGLGKGATFTFTLPRSGP